MELLARTCNTEAMNASRIFARLFVIFGGLFWVSAVWGAKSVYQGAPLSEAAGSAAIFAAVIAVVFVLGLFFEYLTSALLAVGALVLLVAGVFLGWEPGVWATVVFFFVLPMIISAALYFSAARMQRICTLAE
ncbi:MAG TPA: hypothetical protein VFG89_07980 [Coriobacteriia bacterium]|nr:hypothetical protein [Coriobacteriia bacterium]